MIELFNLKFIISYSLSLTQITLHMIFLKNGGKKERQNERRAMNRNKAYQNN